MILDKFMYTLMDEETGGEGEGAPAAGGTLISDAGTDSGAGGDEGQPGNADGGDNAAPEGDQGGAPAAAGDGNDEGEGTPEGAPETYEDFNIPEGVQASEQAMDTFQTFARENGMTQENAQKALDYYTGEVQKLFTEQEQAWNDVRKGWVDTAKADKEFGGHSFQENMKHVATAVDKFGTPGLKEALNSSGMGDNPELIRFFYRVGKLAGEGEFVTGKGDTPGKKTPEQILYPSMN